MIGMVKIVNGKRTIRILVFEPGRVPYPVMLEDSLKNRQALVGGEIECISLPLETVLCCNANGKFGGLPANRQLGNDTIHGSFFLYGDSPEGRGVSLNENQIAYFRDYFTEPEPSVIAFEVRSAKDAGEFLRLMLGGWKGGGPE